MSWIDFFVKLYFMYYIKNRLRCKEDEENPLPILPPGSCGITLIEADISTLYHEVISFDDNNNPTPENYIMSYDVLPTPLLLTFGFHDVGPWRQSGKFPVGRTKLKITPIPRI